MPELLDVLSEEDGLGNPILSNCTLQMGEVALEFKNGRSKVDPRHAATVARHPRLRIPAYVGPVADPPPNVSADLPEAERDAAPEDQVAAAAEYLESEGLEVPVPEADDLDGDTPDIPAGFAAETTDGKPRCWARKGDGSQCSNAAVEGHACGLPAHQKV